MGQQFRDPGIDLIALLVDQVKDQVTLIGDVVDDVQDAVDDIKNTDLSALASNLALVKTDIAGVKSDVAGVKDDTDKIILRQVNVKEATIYKGAKMITLASGTTNLLNVSGKGYLQEAIAGFASVGGTLRITIDGVVTNYVAKNSNVNAVGLAQPVTWATGDKYGNLNTQGYIDTPNDGVTDNKITMLSQPIYFNTSLKIDLIAASQVTSMVYQYWAAVTPP